jgi:hypothetical protein
MLQPRIENLLDPVQLGAIKALHVVEALVDSVEAPLTLFVPTSKRFSIASNFARIHKTIRAIIAR